MNERELPDLRILPISSLVLHEETEPERTVRLTERLAAEQVLKNPPIVAPMPDSEHFIVLDGANRTTSLQALNIPHILAQVVDYDAIVLDTWNHVVTGMDEAQLFETIRNAAGLTLEEGTLELARRLLTARRCLGYLVDPAGNVTLMRSEGSLLEEVRLLNHIVRAYKDIGTIYRIKTDHVAGQEAYYGQIAALVVFPRFTPADIVNLATMDIKLPTGITRHLIPLRALRLNYDLRALADPSQTLEQKNEALKAFIKERLQRRKIRVYQESTVLFDE